MENNKKFLSSLITHVTALGILELAKIALGLLLASAALGFLAKFLTDILVFLHPYRVFVWVLVLSGGALLILMIQARLSRMTPRFPKPTFDYDVLEKHLTYTFDEYRPVRYIKRCKLRARRSGLTAYVDKYSWTGKGPIVIKSDVPEHAFRERERRNVWQYYEIAFNRTLKKDEEIETELVWTLDDRERVAVPFFSSDIDEPTHRLVLRLELNGTHRVRQVIADSSITIGSCAPYETHTIVPDRHGVAEWVIKRPKLLHHYELHWVVPPIV